MNGLSNTLKTWTLMAALGALLVLVGRLLGGTSGMVLAFGFALAMNAFVYWKSDSLALRANGARELRMGEEPRLRAIVTMLAQRAGIPVPRIYIVDRPEPTPSRPAVTRTTRRSPSRRASSRRWTSASSRACSPTSSRM